MNAAPLKPSLYAYTASHMDVFSAFHERGPIEAVLHYVCGIVGLTAFPRSMNAAPLKQGVWIRCHEGCRSFSAFHERGPIEAFGRFGFTPSDRVLFRVP